MEHVYPTDLSSDCADTSQQTENSIAENQSEAVWISLMCVPRMRMTPPGILEEFNWLSSGAIS